MHLYVLQKNSRNKLCVRPRDTYFLFGMFFSLVNNKKYFYEIGHAPKEDH